MKSRVLVSAVFVIACFFAETYAYMGSGCKEVNGWMSMSTSKEVADVASIDLKAEDIVLGQPFSFHLKLCSDESGRPDRVTANATMPAHKHGMNYTPTVVFDEESNSYKVEDFLFHMPGEWEISLSAYKGEAEAHFSSLITVN